MYQYMEKKPARYALITTSFRLFAASQRHFLLALSYHALHSVFFVVAAALLLAQVAQACNLVKPGTYCSALSPAFGLCVHFCLPRRYVSLTMLYGGCVWLIDGDAAGKCSACVTFWECEREMSLTMFCGDACG
jgi:hypothetical protein